jgi:hypothetical protein
MIYQCCSERDRELSALRALVEAAARGDAGLSVVEGPAGIGKTRLLSVARRVHAALAAGAIKHASTTPTFRAPSC